LERDLGNSLNPESNKDLSSETMLDAVSELLVLISEGEYSLAWNLAVLVEKWLREKVFGKAQ
jgi:hypothetical protein